MTTDNQPKYIFQGPEKLLSEEQLATLSRASIRVYCYIANYLARRNVSHLWESNAAISRSAQVTEFTLGATHSELQRAGLLTLTPGVRPNHVKYELFEHEWAKVFKESED
jgi:hypothetical protein